jgi:hypothetical protein
MQSFAGNTSQFIDLTDITISSLYPLIYTPTNAANTSGTLTVTDGTHSAHIKFVGNYTSASFTAVNDGTGGVKITDPPVIEQHPGNAAAKSASDIEGRKRGELGGVDHVGYYLRPGCSLHFHAPFSCCGVIFAMTARYTARPEFSAGALGDRTRIRLWGGAAIALLQLLHVKLQQDGEPPAGGRLMRSWGLSASTLTVYATSVA